MRFLTSWRALTAGFALAVLVLVALAGTMDRQQTERTLQQAVVDAQLIDELLVEARLDSTVLRTGALPREDRRLLDEGVDRLQDEDRLIGLHLWRRDGTLVYSDSDDPEELSAAERASLAAVLDGDPQVEFEHETGRVAPTATVLVEPEDDRNAPSGLVAEVLLPQQELTVSLETAGRRLYGGAGLLLLLMVVAALTARRRMAAREKEALQDPLTGLGNRKALTRAVGAALADGGPSRGHLALLLLDLDGFKAVNDTLGHAVGDDLLVQVAATLRACVRSRDLVARLGGDEFAVLLTDLPDDEAAARVARGVGDALHRPFTVSGVTLEVGASTGVAVSPHHGGGFDELLRHADVAMYRAKREGGGVRLYDEAHDPHDQEHAGTLAQLRHAIADGQLRLHYQPKLALHDGRTVGFEALVRWQHPERGLLPPAAFVPLAERTALLRPLTAWVLQEAVRQCARWRAEGWAASVAVNIAPSTLLEPSLPEQVADLLAAAHLPGEALELEITETAVMVDPVRAAQTLRRLQEVGVAVSLDDFGAGYTSLAYLKSLPVRTLKIDQSFITHLAGSVEDEAVARSVVNLGHDLGLTVVAEGVETDEVRRRLLEMGCDEVQGFLLARPMPAEAVQPWLRRRHGTEPPARPGTALPVGAHEPGD